MTSRHQVSRWSAALCAAALASYPAAPVGAAAVPAAAPSAVAGCVRGDLSGDGVVDLVVGAPGEDVGRARNAGAVNVMLGHGDGTFGGGYYLTQESVGQTSETDDVFGAAVVVADVTYDGCADLVVGVPGENARAGMVVILRGSARGIVLTTPMVLREGYAGATGKAEPGDRFGAALSVGSGHSYPVYGRVLFVGAPGEDVGSVKDAGAVAVFPAAPITTRRSFQLWQGKPGMVGGVAEPGDQFGAALADAALIGAPGEDVGSLVDAGSVYANFDGSFDQVSQDSPGIPDRAEPGDRFGSALAIARVGCTDDMGSVLIPVWVVGAPGEDVGRLADVGYVVHRAGRTYNEHDMYSEEAPWEQMPVPAQAGAGSGAALAGLSTEIVVGSPGRTVGGKAAAGEVAAYPVTSSCWHEWDAGWTASTGARGTPFQGVPETGDRFGSRLAALPAAPESFVVGAPGEDIGAAIDAGAVTVVDVGSEAVQELSQNTTGVPGAAESGDWFGAVAAGF